MNIKDVARMADVSISTISRVINNSAYVSPKIRERIEKVLSETGYRPNSLAKELIHNKTNTIGVILPRIDLGTFAAIFDGISSLVVTYGYNIILANTYDRKEEELRYLDLFHAKRVDGILYFATGIDEDHRNAVSKLHMPTVIIGQSGRQLNCTAVRVDNLGAAQAMVKYLIDIGHRRIGCIAVGDHDENIGKRRREGYVAALAEANIPYDSSLIFTGDFEYPSGKHGAEYLMNHPEGKPSAIYCISDRLAIGASAWLKKNGYRIPQDVSVACLDDPEVLEYYNPAITTMSFDYQKAGKLAGQLIMDIIDGKEYDPVEVVMPYTMRLRDSVQPLTADAQEE